MEVGIDAGEGNSVSADAYWYAHRMPAVTATAVIRRVRPSGITSWDIEYLLAQRSDNAKAFPGAWCFPGGHVEPDEVPEDACLREIFEEVGIKLDSVTLFWAAGRKDRDPRGWMIDLMYFAEVPWDTEIRADDDVQACKWFKKEDFPALAFDHQESYDKYREIRPYMNHKRV